MDNITKIVVEKKIRDRLKKLGNKGDSYNDVIKRLLDEKNIQI